MTKEHPPTISRSHVLIVDDDEELCELLTMRLEYNGFRVTTEHTGRAGIEAIEREVVDAVLLDLRLGEENGIDVLREIQNRTLDVPVVVLTAHGTITAAVEAMNRGAYGFLTKPYDDHDLVQKLRQAVERVGLRREVARLRRIVGEPSSGERLLGTSGPIAFVRELVERIAPTEANVLILGESGTGKEVAARSIHALSARSEGPMVAVNCGALPADLLESELFGHKKGAFTGAMRDKDGLFAAAEGGTLFLDEIGDAPPAVQVKLLRVLEERTYLPVGATRVQVADVRIIAATNRDLRDDVKQGRFREDLFYRIHVVPIHMPPLRDRRDDIPLLAELFLVRAAARHSLPTPHLSHEALHLLMQHDWPGNVRELANVVQGAALLCADGVLRPQQLFAVLPPGVAQRPLGAIQSPGVRQDSPISLLNPDVPLLPLRQAREAFDCAYLKEALRRTRGNVSEAARLTGRNRTDLHELLKRYDVNAAEFRVD